MATNSAYKIFISYGLLEGPRVSKHFRQKAAKQGYEVVSDISEAHIVLGHSAGFYNIQKHSQEKLYVLVGPPTLTHNTKTLLYQIAKKLIYELQNNGVKRTVKKTAKNLYYIHGIRRMFLLRKMTLRRQIPTTNTVLIRNKHDVFNSYDSCPQIESSHTMLSLPGDHDDIWVNPDIYLQIINQAKRS